MKDNFEQNIRKVLNDPPQYPFQEELWEGLEERLALEKKSNDNKLGGFPSLLPLLLLALLFAGTSLFLYKANRNAQLRIDNLETKIQVQNSTVVKMDTIFEKHVQVIYDTIYKQQIIVERKVINVQEESNYLANNNAKAYFIPDLNLSQFRYFNNSSNFFANNAIGLKGLHNYTGSNGPNNRIDRYGLVNEYADAGYHSTDVVGAKEITTGLLDEMKNIGDYAIFDYSHRDFPLEKQVIKLKRGLTYFIGKTKPSRFAVALSGGYGNPLNFSKGSHIFLGKVEAEVGFGKNISFVAGLEYLFNNFNLTIDEVNNGSDFPVPTPTNPSDVLHEIYGDFQYLQIPFGIKFNFKNLGRFQPYLSGGLLAHKANYSKLTYEYHGMFKEYEIVEESVVPKAFVLDDYWAGLGIYTSISKNVGLLLEVTSQFELKPPQYRFQNHQFLKYNLGAQYRF